MPQQTPIPGQAKNLYLLTMRQAPKRKQIDWPLVGILVFVLLLGIAGRMDYDAAREEQAAYHQGR